MLDLETARRVIDEEWQATVERLERLPPAAWDRPTRLPGWAIRDLAAHFVYGTSLEADALRRMAAGTREPAENATIDASRPPVDILAAVRQRAGDLQSVVRSLDPGLLADGICPMPYGPIPLALALQVFTMEAGVHGNDLASALGDERPLRPEVCLATDVVLAVSLPALGGASQLVPPDGLALRVVGGPVPLTARFRDGGWHFGEDGGRWTATIRGDESAAVLFAMGRIPYDHPGLRIEGDRAAASRFKEYFPGP